MPDPTPKAPTESEIENWSDHAYDARMSFDLIRRAADMMRAGAAAAAAAEDERLRESFLAAAAERERDEARKEFDASRKLIAKLRMRICERIVQDQQCEDEVHPTEVLEMVLGWVDEAKMLRAELDLLKLPKEP